jgi:hypothetical protein
VQLGIAPEHCGPLQFALLAIIAIPQEQLRLAVQTIDRAESFGPLVDPTFFIQTPNAFATGAKNKDIFQALVQLREALHETDAEYEERCRDAIEGKPPHE